jgi:hypothetical protein
VNFIFKYKNINILKYKVKKIFLKAPLRVEKFKQEAPSLSLPPKPVLTRRGTWLDAAMYYCENYSTIEKIVSELDSNEASSIKFQKELFSSDLSGKLAYIKSNFFVVSKAIACLEAVGVEMNDTLDIVMLKKIPRKCWSEIMGFQ